MKFAIDRFVNNRDGKEMEVSAEDIYEQCHGGKPLRADTRFFCPECHESVFWHCRGGQLPDFFSHRKRLDSSPECDKRVDGRSDLYIYERTGLPLYLSHEYGEVYSLNIAFPAIGERLLQWAYNNNVIIRVNDSVNIKVTPSRFFADDTTLIPVDFFPSYEKNYKISIISQSSTNSLCKKWSDYADGFTYGGAIFNIQANSGKKVKRGDSITIGKEYYAVSKDFVPRTWYSQDNYSEIKYKVMGRIELNDTVYNVYSFVVNVSTDSPRFKVINNYFYSRFKVWLVEMASTIVPIWPPVVERGEWISFSEKGKLYCSVVSGNDSPKVFTYVGSDAVDISVKRDNDDNKTVRLGIYSTDPILVSVDRKYTGREIGIKKSSIPRVDNYHTVEMSSETENISNLTTINYGDISKGIHVKTNTKFAILEKNNKNIFKTVSVKTSDVFVEVDDDVDELLFVYGRVGLGFIPFKNISFVYPENECEFDENDIVIQMKRHMVGSMILAPIWINSLLQFCLHKHYYKMYHTITNAITGGRIKKGLAFYLNQLRRNFING